MIDKKELTDIKKKKSDWEKECYNSHIKKHSERRKKFENLSWNEIKQIYSPDDIAHLDYLKDIGFPGEYPFLRGVHPTMYRGRLWTYRMFSGFGSAEETN
jgi:methylmalonyl-CoA mutase N-terminal domain/subunit